MKKFMMMIMCMTLLAGCGQDNKANDNKADTTPNNDMTDKNDDMTNNQSNDWYGRFESSLKDKKMVYSTKTSLDATSIGGKEGYRYATENGNIDVYRFEDGDAYDKIVKDKKINVNGTDSKVEVKDHMIIVSDGLSDDVMNIFRGL